MGVLKWFVSIVDMYEVLKSCDSFVVVCVYNGSVVDVYGVLESCKCVIVFCEYIGRLLDVKY